MAIGLVIIVTMMIIPLPPMLLDILLTLNISLAVIILLVCLFIKEPLEYSSFPIILLVSTIFRLGLNVSSTRLILLYGSAGEVIHSFGQFVVGGNYVVGFIIFIILVLINFMVITGGATRVAEVSARFTLDSMPGKQLSIDADLNSGLINEEQAKARRRKLEREADFYGTMDGASKFVKGDATAGIIITVVNIFAGIVIGVWQLKMDIMTALSTFTILTVGDGLVSQLPALLISFATGLIVSRASGQDDSLSDDIKREMFSNPTVLAIVSVLLFCLGIVPGMPTLPFIIISLTLAGFAYSKTNKKEKEEAAAAVEAQKADEEQINEGKIKKKRRCCILQHPLRPPHIIHYGRSTFYTSFRFRRDTDRWGRSCVLPGVPSRMPSASYKAPFLSPPKGSDPTAAGRRASWPLPRPYCNTASPDRSRSLPPYPRPSSQWDSHSPLNSR